MSAADPNAATSAAPAVESVRAEVGNIPAIEGMRGIAVLWVMVFHYVVVRDGKFADAFIVALKDWPVLDAFVRNGYLGVDLFFLITGFLLTLPWFRHADAGLPHPHWRAFYARRARRILPAYYVQLVILFFLVVPVLLPKIWMQSTAYVVGNIGAHATFLHYTNPLTSASMTVNGALWTLAIEMQYYLLLPLVAPLFVKWPWRSLVAAFLIAAGWRWLAWHDLDWLVKAYVRLAQPARVTDETIRHFLATQLPAYAFHFALGILLGRMWMLRRAKVVEGIARLLPVAVAAGSVWALLAALRGGTAILGDLGWATYPVVIAVGFGAVASWPSKWLSRVVANPALAWVGKVSYSAYLYHLPVLLLFNHFLPGFGAFIAFGAWVAIVLAISAASFRYVEKPYLARRAV
ncbi:MAG: acyltransferase [Betaproteobacteria bacterium]|nr:acyltransferase [Betaproteobacteria bacterium]